jgi:hypothetical protein
MSYSVAARDSLSSVDTSSNFDYAPLGNAYKLTKDQVVYASGMTPTVMSTLALRFPQGLEANTWDITKPRRISDNSYSATIDMMAPVNLTGEMNPVAYPTMSSAYKM